MPGAPEKIRGYRGGYLPTAAARDREGAARGRGARRRVDQRARARHRHRRARRVGDGRLSGHDCRHVAARGARGTAQRPVGGGDGGEQRAARSVRRAQPVVLLRRVARARAHRSRQPPHPGRSHQVRGVRAAVRRRPRRSAGHDVQEILGILAEQGLVHRAGRGSRRGPGRTSRIRPTPSACGRCRRTTSSSSTPRSETRVIGETDFTSGPATLHPKAIYIVEGQLYQVERLDFEGRKAFVRAIDCDYYTTAITYTKVTPIDTFADDGADLATRWARDGQASVRSHGEVHVVSRVVGFKKIKFYTNENVGSGELDLPEQQMHTTSYWLTIPASVMGAAAVRLRRSPRRRRRAGVRAEAGRAAAADVRRPRHRHLDRQRRDRRRRRRRAASPQTIFVYDNYPGGIGFSAPLFEVHGELLDGHAAADRRVPVRERLSRAASGPIGNTGPLAKVAALRILDSAARRTAAGSRRRRCRAGERRGRAVLSSLADRIRGIVAPERLRRTDSGRAHPTCGSADLRACAASGAPDIAAVLGGAWRGRRPRLLRRRSPVGAVGAARTRAGRRAGRAAATRRPARRRCSPAARRRVRRSSSSISRRPGSAAAPARSRFSSAARWFDDDGAFVTRQFLLTRHADERMLLEAVAGELARAGALVSFNGKSFDAPLLEGRYLFHRLAWRGRRAAARRRAASGAAVLEAAGGTARQPVGRAAQRSEGCSLQALERQILGARRVGDVPGFEIPGALLPVRAQRRRARRSRPCSSTTASIC